MSHQGGGGSFQLPMPGPYGSGSSGEALKDYPPQDYLPGRPVEPQTKAVGPPTPAPGPPPFGDPSAGQKK